MKIELKNIKHMESMSQETNCYSASLYVDGKKIGEVSNEGHGGPDMFYGDRAAFAKAEAWVKENKPPLECSFGGDPLPMDLELLCGELLTDWLVSKDLRSAMRSKVIFTRPGEDGVFELKWKGVRKIDDRHIAAVRNKYPKATVLNALPFEEALAIYRANG